MLTLLFFTFFVIKLYIEISNRRMQMYHLFVFPPSYRKCPFLLLIYISKAAGVPTFLCEGKIDIKLGKETVIQRKDMEGKKTSFGQEMRSDIIIIIIIPRLGFYSSSHRADECPSVLRVI